MHTPVSFYDFERAFHDMDRKDNFSHYGLRMLFDYLKDYEEETGEDIELDVIALCCEYTEYDSVKELCDAYSLDFTYDEDEELLSEIDTFEYYLKYVKDFTVVCCEADCIIILDI